MSVTVETLSLFFLEFCGLVSKLMNLVWVGVFQQTQKEKLFCVLECTHQLTRQRQKERLFSVHLNNPHTFGQTVLKFVKQN